MRDSPLGHFLTAYMLKRFGSKTARFKSAVALGFVIVTLGFVAAGPIAGSSSAEESLWGAMSTFFNGGARVEQAVATRQDFSHARHRHHTARLAHRHATVTAALDRDTGVEAGGHSMCVRLCDGYAFPVGAYHGAADNAAHQAICQSSCPGAKTALYVLPNGSDEIASGVELNSGRRYSALPDAFHYTTVLDDACTCHKENASGKALSLLHDFTLRRGDAVMTATGVRVFHGSRRFPYRRGDFVVLARSHDVHRTTRATMKAIERASLVRPAGSQNASPVLSQNPPMSVRPAGPSLVTGAAQATPADRG